MTNLDGLETATQDLSMVSAYNTINGNKGSSTGNITGVYDLNGGIWERVSGYILNGDSSLTNDGTNSYIGASGYLIGATNIVNPNGYQSLSTRTYTVYPYDVSDDNYINNYNTYKELLSNIFGYGDAILETSKGTNQTESWNSDYSYFVNTSGPFLGRGGYYGNEFYSGIFAFWCTAGSSFYLDGFRTTLIAE